jgi:hypothetical protein
MKIDTQILDWLMAGDPAIQWQTQRDLMGAEPGVYDLTRQKIAETGWGAAYLEKQDPAGTWGGGLYSPKWISTTYVLLDLRWLGLPAGHPQAMRGLAQLWSRGLYKDGGINLFHTIDYSETCINGMLLGLFSFFRYPDERIHSIVQFLLNEQMQDGGWNCERIKGATHSSFHSTLSVLEGLAEYRRFFGEEAVPTLAASLRAHEFLLIHRLYHSHRTGEIVDPSMTRMNFPPRWRYDFIRVLDYLRSVGAEPDERMQDGIELLQQKQRSDGRWPAYRPWAGRMFFEMEKGGEAGRWNTLLALRVMRWWTQTPANLA